MHLQTFTGRFVHPAQPSAEDIDIRDIAHALSLQCRFGGHAKCAYSVAQHSYLASKIVPPADALWALLHDASEAYLVDVPTPVKRLAAMDGYRALEAQMQRLIFQTFGLRGEMPESVKEADEALVLAEAEVLLAAGAGRDFDEIRARVAPATIRIIPVVADQAERVFLRRFFELTER